MLMIYVDIVLLTILMALTCFTCCYCVYRVYRLRQAGQVSILLRPTRVLFSLKKPNDSNELCSVVAYKNPFTGNFCVNKNHMATVFENKVVTVTSPDSGCSDQYEPVTLITPTSGNGMNIGPESIPVQTTVQANALDKTWNWNYKEYQI